jgi:lipopolysaccharide export LptBFGC system permease protein LptF
MDEREYNDAKWQQYRNVEVDEDLMNESLGIFESIERRAQHGTDVVNWEERSEMEEVYRRHGHLLQTDDEYYTDQPQGQNEGGEEPVSSSPEERELMNDLAGIMGQLEGVDDNKK